MNDGATPFDYLATVDADGWGLFLAAGGSFSAREWAALGEESRHAIAQQGRALDAARALLIARCLAGGGSAVLSAIDGGEAADEEALDGAAHRALARHWPGVVR